MLNGYGWNDSSSQNVYTCLLPKTVLFCPKSVSFQQDDFPSCKYAQQD